MRKGSETKNEVNHDKWSGSRIEIMWQCNMGKSYWIWQRLVLHVTHCHTWCVTICRGKTLNLIPPIVLIERKLSTKEACVHKKVSKWNVVLVEMKNFSPTSKLKTRVNWKCSSTTSTFSMDFLLQAAEIINLSKFFQLWAFLKGNSYTQKVIEQKNFLSNFFTCTTMD